MPETHARCRKPPGVAESPSALPEDFWRCRRPSCPATGITLSLISVTTRGCPALQAQGPRHQPALRSRPLLTDPTSPASSGCLSWMEGRKNSLRTPSCGPYGSDMPRHSTSSTAHSSSHRGVLPRDPPCLTSANLLSEQPIATPAAKVRFWLVRTHKHALLLSDSG